jgi:hypothetical protein
VAGLAAHAQEAVLEPPALQVCLELFLHIRGQCLALLGQVRNERGVVLLHQPVEPRFLRTVALVGERRSGFRAVWMHRLRVLAQAGDGSV